MKIASIQCRHETLFKKMMGMIHVFLTLGGTVDYLARKKPNMK